MKSYTNKHIQFELFPSKSNQVNDKPRSRIRFANIRLSFENIIVLGIVIIMSMVVSFSLGVRKGRIVIRRHNALKESAVPSQPVSVPDAGPAHSEGFSPGERGLAILEKNGTIDQSVAALTIVEAGISLPIKQESPDGEMAGKDLEPVEKTYTIQVASFKQELHAQKEAMILKGKGYETLVMPKGSYSIVCVGKFDRREEAQKFSTKLKKKYKDCLIRRL